jgi:hypothetical protein
MTIVTPTVHLNGTSAKALMEGYLKAYRLLIEAGKALQEAAPHGRDYYVQSGNAVNVAIDQHRARLRKIESVIEDLDFICVSISEQRKDR